MHISIKWFTESKYPTFNVGLSSKEGNDVFLEIKGCRIASGAKGDFVGWPSTKNENSGKYWNHVYGSNDFNKVVLEKALESMPKKSVENQTSTHTSSHDSFDNDIPF